MFPSRWIRVQDSKTFGTTHVRRWSKLCFQCCQQRFWDYVIGMSAPYRLRYELCYMSRLVKPVHKTILSNQQAGQKTSLRSLWSDRTLAPFWKGFFVQNKHAEKRRTLATAWLCNPWFYVPEPLGPITKIENMLLSPGKHTIFQNGVFRKVQWIIGLETLHFWGFYSLYIVCLNMFE